MKAETTHQFQVMADVFKESLAGAIRAHDSAMSWQFSELKLLLANPGCLH